MDDDDDAKEKARRGKRRTAKVVNYAKEQQFSDASDIFEDSDDSAPKAKKRGRPRRSDANDMVYAQDDDTFKKTGPIYTERGYDTSLLPIRERFPFLPEFEADGSPKIDLIVGRRPIDEKEESNENEGKDNEDEKKDEEDMSDEDDGKRRKRTRRSSAGGKGKGKSKSPAKATKEATTLVEYEYLIKYKGRSYLHLEWKTGADLESMNKSAKGIYRRYLKKIGSGDEELEDPNFDPSFAIPQRICDEAQQEITVELSDKELLKWEKERAKELAAEKDDDSDSDDDKPKKAKVDDKKDSEDKEKKEEPTETKEELMDWEGEDDIDFRNVSMDRLRKILESDGSYYPNIEGSDNAYRDGYVTEPPKKPRASYLFFQCTMRNYFKKKHPGTTIAELMSILGEHWQAMSDEEQAPFIQLAREEMAAYDRERALMEKAQKPNEVWQPIRRCRMVLNKIKADSFADIFLSPVELDDFPDYEETIDQPMDLGTVETKLNNKKYQAPEQFARDVRKIWNNCKIYNQHGSAIWHVADYMSKQFERLYHAWVLDFRERYLRWANPKARPWEQTCRQCDGKCGTPNDQLVMCDHCDAPYGFKCLPKPLKKVPKGVWHCADCKPRLNTLKGTRMLSAMAEAAARKRADLGDTPKKKINQTMFLVKWEGLGYEYCTWETKEDISGSGPNLIAVFHRLNNTFPDEPDMPEADVNNHLNKAKHLNLENAGGTSCVPELRSQLYSQSRALQFSKFGKDLPEGLCSLCGPKTKASTICKTVKEPSLNRDVVECISSLVDHVSKENVFKLQAKVTSHLPPLLTGEYDVIIPITAKGLMMNVGEIHGSVAFLGYRSFPDGSKGPSEIKRLIRNVGDKIIAVDGVSTVKKTFQQVIAMLKESGKHKYAFMRFLETKFSVCDSDLASVGATGRYAFEELQKKFSTDRERLLVQRKQQLIEAKTDKVDEAEESDGSAEADSDEESEDGSEGEFQPDSDAEEDELMKKKRGKKAAESPEQPSKSDSMDQTPDSKGDKEKTEEPSHAKSASKAEDEKDEVQPIVLRHETTRSLAYRLLDVDIGDSSDEGGDEDCAFFYDGMDNTYTTMAAVAAEGIEQETKLGKVEKRKSQTEKKKEEPTVPVKRNEFSELGERSKLAASVLLAKQEPAEDNFDNFPYPSKKALETSQQEAMMLDEAGSPLKAAKRSTVKIEQIDTTTDEIVHVWANAQSAAATMQLPLDELKRLLDGDYDEDLGDEIGGYRWRFALAGAKVTAGLETTGRGKKGREAWLEFRDKLYDPSEPHLYKNGNRLRDYQVDGVNWLASTYYKRHGCILADEMGLGKTVQIVSFIEHLYRVEKIKRPYLVVVPLSTVEHWRREFDGWTEMVTCVYHDRQRVWRDVLREYEWYYKDRPHTADFLKFDVLVTTYDTLIGDFDVISQIPFRVAVVDEAHRLRNQKGKLLECMREISAKGTLQYGFQSRVLMSGTPLQNDLNELWTLLNFIEPFKFPDLEEFQANFGNMANREQVENLQQMISPYMLRRIKEDVATDIPSKEETVIDVELTSIQKTYYRAIFEHNHAFLNMGATRTNAPKLMNIQMELRKVCNHPFLLDGVEHRETEKQFKEFLDSGAFEGKTPEEQHHMITVQGMIMSSGKMVLLDKLLPKLRQEGHKILIFSQMVKMLDFISEYCEFRTFPYERLDGRVRGTERQKAIDRFEREDDSFLFLLSTRAGGVGINLTAADICIIFDSDWNPQNDVQAQARCHRIGQTKDVKIFRLITSRTFEQEMFDRASKKLGLEQAVLGTFEQANEDDKPTNKEMEQLLKRGAYALIEDENDEEGKAFCADDIENILAKRTRTRVIEGAKTASWLNKQGMVVSKSKFSSESGAGKLDMDDPLFWQKVMPDFVTPSIMLQKLDEISAEILGSPKKGPGRGRWREKREQEAAAAAAAAKEAVNGDDDKNDPDGEENDKKDKPKPDEDEDKAESEASDKEEDEDDEEADEGNDSDSEDSQPKKKKFKLTRTGIRKVAKFMADLKSMMASVLDEAEDKTLSATEKATCQKLMLQISINEKLFNEQQRQYAKGMLKKLEGDRRRRCRTSDQPRFTPGRSRRGNDEVPENVIPEELRIVSTKKVKRKRRTKAEMEADRQAAELLKNKRKRTNSDDEVDEDGYLRHSDSEGDWSDVAGGDGIYGIGKKRNVISRKEANRRRGWCVDDDSATAAGRPWPVFPRNVVTKVLRTMLEYVFEYDESKGGVFSVPVPKDDFPEYYEQIKKPMDYGTMKKKLDKGEYRSAQAMQKDFILVMQNCLAFNSANSDIVKDAKQQALLRPSLLRKAAAKHHLFLSEDGTVLEVVEDDAKEKGGEKKEKKKKKSSSSEPPTKKKKVVIKKKATEDKEGDGGGGKKGSVKKPRIQISLSTSSKSKDTSEADGNGKTIKKRRRRKPGETEDNAKKKTESDSPNPKRKRRKLISNDADGSSSKATGLVGKGASQMADPDEDSQDEDDRPITSMKVTRSKAAAKNDSETESENDAPSKGDGAIFMDVDFWKKEREKLKKGDFLAARALFSKYGPWSLPDLNSSKPFKLIAKATLSKMDKHDKYSVFADAVSDSEAPGYSDVISNPMHFSRMKQKIEKKQYGSSFKKLYEDFLLVFDNCYAYNDADGDVVKEAARLFGLLPEAFATAASHAAKPAKK
ncbi:CHD3-type chromatin-remodeling factor CHR7 [Seminavis robusta]|uniref:CHD3-type chromatin-remodeling factor CHR7 n=1 Tax=Seminavis robusta TaxID=568900 RepID=A0A9N8D7H7_9STRA|nr:CHD3-type chromatin-remodeling factor CHR7 [Seminavis robusta]|eukprot:Sro29_g019150.1 CHD3-type chromatin-remodeling factor CHR7 (2662) ;mRNA; r:76803-85817